jgi:hypothetical protein
MAVGFPAKTNFATGEVLTATNMNDITGTLNLLQSTLYPAGRNKIINGDFNVWQRGTTVGPTVTLNAYLADRWQLGSAGETTTYSQQTFTPGAAPVAGYESQYFARLAVTSSAGASNFAQFLQRIEDVRTFAADTVTISYWAKADAAKNVSLELQQNFGSGGSASVNTFIVKQALTTSWARYSATFTVPSVSGKTIGTSSYADFRFWLSAGSTFDARTSSLGQQNITFDVWGVQVEDGSTASPFQTASGSIGGELALCQRYLPRTDVTDMIGYAFLTNNGIWTAQYPVTARAKPTGITLVGTFAAYALNTATTVTPTFNTGEFSMGSVTAAFTITAGQGSRLQGGAILWTGCEL